MEALLQLGLFALLLAVGLLFGRAAERRHYRELIAREQQYSDILVFNGRHLPAEMDIGHSLLVSGSVVLAEDYFKRVAASLKGFFGGRLTVYESLLDRGRREAVLRMKQEARQHGACMIFNVRFETSSISETGTMFSAEFLSYGTALVAARAQ
jgi:uncharacterized protein YbjQ (UPF0145 family)